MFLLLFFSLPLYSYSFKLPSLPKFPARKSRQVACKHITEKSHREHLSPSESIALIFRNIRHKMEKSG